MSLAVDGRGGVHILDQVNNRVVHRSPDGKAESATKIDLQVPQDIAVGKDGSAAVMDRLSSKAIAIYDPQGVYKGELPLGGAGIPETGAVTGVFVDGKDVYVEKEHATLVLVGDTTGLPATARTEIPGRPSRDGKSFLSAGITDETAGRVYVSAIDRVTLEHRFTRELRFNAPTRSIVGLDSDAHGIIYLAVEVDRGVGAETTVLSCLEPMKGAPAGTADMPANMMPEETFKDLVALDDGGVVYAVRTELGVTYQRFDCR